MFVIERTLAYLVVKSIIVENDSSYGVTNFKDKVLEQAIEELN